MELSRFRELLGEPSVNGAVERDWRTLEDRAGIEFPDDYKGFVSAYGSGCVNDQLYLFHPRGVAGDDGLRLESLWTQAGYAYTELSRNAPDMYPYAVYPTAADGCLPIARSSSGNHIFLSPPDAEGKDWSVVIDMGEWVELPLSFTDFLWAALHGDLEIPVIEDEPSFEPVGALEP
ncbi:SMI1/KNR4 family protein [Streptomyces sp. NPDC102394]|uniref:SMI1/KNR4 family protein n=1 Tax=Streptomyces sp. NPDC102394 TaxID=3366167 RepID=UPI0038091D5A